MIRGILQWIALNKMVTFLSVCLFSFVIATIAVAVEKDNYRDDLETCENKLNGLTTPRPEVTTESGATTTSSGNTEGDQNYRLPTDVIPIKYIIKLWPHLDSNNFDGWVNITVSVKKEVDQFILHNNGLNITTLNLIRNDDESKLDVDFEVIKNDTEFFIINPKQMLAVTEYTLQIEYVGALDGIIGFYSSQLISGKCVKMFKELHVAYLKKFIYGY